MSLDRRLLSAVLASAFLPAFFALPALLRAQERPTPLVTQPVDDAHLAVLPGSVHPLAKASDDQGPVSESAAADRILILLNRPPDRQAAFLQYLKAEHTPGSPQFHRWLTPAQIAAQFGPAASDIQAVSAWLNGSGVSVNRVSKAGRFIEFSGTVGELNAAFHTRIDQYLIDGVTHRANATPLRIPQALSAVIAAVSPLDDFRLTSQLQAAGRASWNSLDRRFEPDFTGPPSWSPLQYAVAPADFATQYDLAPLSSAGVNGTGITIGIIDESNIDLSLPADYRSVFGLLPNPVQVIVDGQDPGWNPSEGETYLDVEVAGAVAPAATIDLYLSNGSPLQDPIALASLRAVDDDLADIISVSWGGGENDMTTAENAMWNALWEQAAAQGQTVLVSSGDYGQSPDDYFFWVDVNGVASTPWDIAAGGTDFYYSDYASGASSSANDWNATNDPTTKGSLKAPLPEQVWNDAFGLDAISDGLGRGEIYAGGGGASSCITQDATTSACTGGYPKPAWQAGPGVPADGARDVPDISLFASNGANLSAWADCDFEGSCTPDASGNFAVDLVGGTSASAPAMAGVMALVDQKSGRQGQADTVLYPLAQQRPSAFHDITYGGNWDLCQFPAPDCNLGADSLGEYWGESTVYSAGPGYDQASGLGSLDIANLVNNWNAISFAATTTSLQLSPPTVQHGKNVTVSASVQPSSGSGMPTGAVSILTTSDEPASRSQAAITLAGGSGSATLNSLPGGTYQVTGQYGGDNSWAGSTSSPQTLIVNPEKSTLSFSVVPYQGVTLTTLVYGEGVSLVAQPIGVNAPAGGTDGVATGAITFTLDGNTTSTPLNASGVSSWATPILSVGSHTASASYAGDDSFKASSTALPVDFTVGKGYTQTTLYASQLYTPVVTSTINAGSSVTISAQVQGYSTFQGSEAAVGTAPAGMLPPTGTLTVGLAVYNGGWTVPYSQTATITPVPGFYGAVMSFAQVTFNNLAAGQYSLFANYSGDTNYQSFSCTDYFECVGLGQFTVVAPTSTPAASTTALTVTPSSISGAEGATFIATVSGPSGATVVPTGYVSLYANGSAIGFGYATLGGLTPATTGDTATFTIDLPPDYFPIDGLNQVTAIYSGDANYMGSTSAAVPVNVAQTGSDFTLSPGVPQINVVAGNTVSAAFTMTSLYNFNGTVGLTCAPSTNTFSCSITPSSVNVNGTASASLSITTVNPNASTSQLRRFVPRSAAAFALALILFIPLRRRWSFPASLLLLVLIGFAASGCGSHGTTGTPPPPVNPNATPAGTYTILVTGTSAGITHDVKLSVVVTAPS
ncbi:MAG TPA: Ig-like domain repeat protein [Acidobacteriaceae bacterium]|nr:Ig-like domain repeat protein [Acidobacteriaceae bacterium]